MMRRWPLSAQFWSRQGFAKACSCPGNRLQAVRRQALLGQMGHKACEGRLVNVAKRHQFLHHGIYVLQQYTKTASRENIPVTPAFRSNPASEVPKATKQENMGGLSGLCGVLRPEAAIGSQNSAGASRLMARQPSRQRLSRLSFRLAITAYQAYFAARLALHQTGRQTTEPARGLKIICACSKVLPHRRWL